MSTRIVKAIINCRDAKILADVSGCNYAAVLAALSGMLPRHTSRYRHSLGQARAHCLAV